MVSFRRASTYPVLKAYTLGQVQTISTMLFAASMLAWVRDRRALAGAAAGVICLVKPQLGLLIVWALMRREHRFAIGWFAAVVPLGLLSLAHYGLASHLEYVRLASFVTAHSWSYHANQSANGLLNRVLFNGANLVWDPHFAEYNRVVYLGTIVSSLVLVTLALVWRPKQHQAAPLVDYCIAALSFTMASPVAWEHHYGILAPMFAALLPMAWVGRAHDDGRASAWLLLMAYLLTSNLLEPSGLLASSRLNVLQSYVWFGGVLMLVYLYAVRARRTGAA